MPEFREIRLLAQQELIAGNQEHNLEFQFRRAADGKVLDIHSLGVFDPQINMIFGHPKKGSILVFVCSFLQLAEIKHSLIT
ncbi:MAG: hypothetical protein GX335_07970 [Firmicutes bacterium]|nr:hypothetical protein [Bacillota bacterium]